MEDLLRSMFAKEMSTLKVKPNLRYNYVPTQEVHLALNLYRFFKLLTLDC